MNRTQKNPIIYSDEFKKSVLEEYSENERIKDLLEKDSYSLGRYLSDGTSSSIPYTVVIQKLESGDVKTLLNLAYQIKHRVDLYEMWGKEVFID